MPLDIVDAPNKLPKPKRKAGQDGLGFIEHFKELGRELLREYHDQLKPEQIEMFNRMYTSIDVIPWENMSHAYHQVRATLDSNNKKDQT